MAEPRFPPLPLALRVEGRRVVVIGGGAVAARKVATLLRHGAEVHVVSPELSTDVATAADAGRLTTRRGLYESSDLDGAVLVIASTSDPSVNATIVDDCRRRGIPVNVIDDPERCDVVFPAVLERGAVQVAVWSGGAPALSRVLRNRLRKRISMRYAGFSRLSGILRERARASLPTERQRRAFQDALVADAVLDLVESGDERAASLIEEICAAHGVAFPDEARAILAEPAVGEEDAG